MESGQQTKKGGLLDCFEDTNGFTCGALGRLFWRLNVIGDFNKITTNAPESYYYSVPGLGELEE